MLRQQKRYMLFYICQAFFKIINHIQLFECRMTQLNISMNFLQEVENWEVTSFRGKVLERIKRLYGYTNNPKSPLSTSDMKRAFQKSFSISKWCRNESYKFETYDDTRPFLYEFP